MDTLPKTTITVEATVNAPINKVWKLWTTPEDIKQWNNATDEWHTPQASNDLRKGGKFVYRMEAKDGSMGFDFNGLYDTVEKNKKISYTMEDGRKVDILFQDHGDSTKVTEIFEAESTHSIEMQKSGWQSIMDNFKRYVENYQ